MLPTNSTQNVRYVRSVTDVCQNKHDIYVPCVNCLLQENIEGISLSYFQTNVYFSVCVDNT